MSSLNFEAQRSHCVLDGRNVALVAHYCRPTEVSGIMCVPTPQRACDTLRLGLALLVDVDVGNHCIDDRQRVQQLPLLPSQEVRMVRKLDALSSEKRRGAREKSEIDPLRRDA